MDPRAISDELHNQSLCWEDGSTKGFGNDQGIGVRSFQQLLYLHAVIPRRIGEHQYKVDPTLFKLFLSISFLFLF